MKLFNYPRLRLKDTSPTLYPLTIMVLAFFLLYLETILRLFRNFLRFSNSYGLIILAISLWMIWEKRDLLRKLSVRPNMFVGTALTVLGCLMLVAGKISTTILLQYVSMIVTLSGLVWLVLGRYYFEALWLPLAYLFLMFPLIAEILGNYSTFLQYVAASIGSSLLKVVGMPVFQSGCVIQLPHITLTVTRECNGINHIIALVALGVPLAFRTHKTWLKRALFILFAVFVAIFFNGLRVALIALWTLYYPARNFHGPFDIFYGFSILFLGATTILLASGLTRILRPKKTTLQNTKAPTDNPAHGRSMKEHPHRSQDKPTELLARKEAINSDSSFTSGKTNKKSLLVPTPNANHQTAPTRRLAPIVAAILLLTAPNVYLHLSKPQPVYLQVPLSTFPVEIEGWTGHDIRITDKRLLQIGADSQLNRKYRDSSGNEIKLFIGYFSQQQQGKEIIHYHLDWLHRNAEVIRIPSGSPATTIKKTTSSSNGKAETIYFWYDVNGRILVDRYRTKLVTLMDAFTRRRTNGALVLITAANDGGTRENSALQFVQSVLPVASSFLNNHAK